jgi:heptose I phosphotransferase
MSRGEFAARWPERLAPHGLRTITDLLGERLPPVQAQAERWTRLSKPGLGGRERWRLTLDSVGGDAQSVYIKRYRRSGIRDQLDRWLRQASWHSRAWWEFQQSQLLREKYLNAPEAVSYAEQMAGPLEQSSAVVLAAVRGDAADRVWQRLAEQKSPLLRGIARHELIVRLARFVSAFHQTGLCHRDLYLCHIFVELDEQGDSPPEFAIIDLGRAFRPWLRRMRWVLKDLSQLDYSARQIGLTRADRLRGLAAYLGLERGAARTRWYARSIARRSDAILRREIRKGRA